MYKRQVLNYAEFGEIACARTDAKGKKVLETGFGTLQVTAYKDGAYAEQLVDCLLYTSSPGRLFFPAEYRICITSDHSLYTCI